MEPFPRLSAFDEKDDVTALFVHLDILVLIPGV